MSESKQSIGEVTEHTSEYNAGRELDILTTSEGDMVFYYHKNPVAWIQSNTVLELEEVE